ncbi:MAG: hypothetical protein HYW15_02090 [Candidatus Giovannonibacteria bacterium]|nr:MAG: hypothetical protein HYW15_02090 [Candidatus Giovannonibacteria bacterium]
MKIALLILLFSCLLDTLSSLCCARKDKWDWSSEKNPIIQRNGKALGWSQTLWMHNLWPITLGAYYCVLISFLSSLIAVTLVLLMSAIKLEAALSNFIYVIKRS